MLEKILGSLFLSPISFFGILFLFLFCAGGGPIGCIIQEQEYRQRVKQQEDARRHAADRPRREAEAKQNIETLKQLRAMWLEIDRKMRKGEK